ncbi:hypothetical protein ACFQ2T_04865 [Methylophilus flavus]|uniref:Tail fiber protein n=1 Tax=Methylophilus flavus TaxID=640084 RepID=A0ABW3P6I6_9PROT
MSTAPDYTPGTSFADDEANNVAGRSLVKTTSLDTELANVSTSINDINANLQAIQRDDNKLKDGIIEPYALSEQTNALIAVGGCNPRGTWAPDTDYAYKDLIQRNNIAQICLQQHNSGSLFVQSFWLPISGDGTSAANAAAAAASASAASTSASSASASATTATNAASSASTNATNAALSATNASNSATSSATSATDSSNSASEASVSAASAAAAAASITAPENNASDPTHTSVSSTKAASPEWVRGLIGELRHARTSFSSPYTPASGESFLRPHGLTGKVPFGGRIILECVVAEFGYAPGDRVTASFMRTGGTILPLINVISDSTNIGMTLPSGYSLAISVKTTGNAATPTALSWKYAFEFTYIG